MKPVCPKCGSGESEFTATISSHGVEFSCGYGFYGTFTKLNELAQFFPSPQWRDVKVEWQETRFQEFDDLNHPANIWWRNHGQYMMAGGGRTQFIWACRGWIAREQLAAGVEVTGDSLWEEAQQNNTIPSGPEVKEKK